jgi:LytS/YehU family sensor histidine kinase
VDVRVEREDDLVRITVHDNGVGRRVAAERRIHRPGSSMGMDLVRKRLAIHDKARRTDGVQVIDEVRTDGTSHGTSVVLRMGFHDIRQHA